MNNFDLLFLYIATKHIFQLNLINRYQNIPHSDLIIIYMGTNDYGHETPLGTIDDTTDTSFYGALNVIIPWLIENRPNSRIVIMTPIHRYGFGTSSITGTAFTYDYLPNGRGYKLSDYVNALKDIANKYSLPVIDLYNLFTLDPTDATTRTNYIPDGLHPNAAGHRLLADTIKNSLSYISKKTSGESTDNGDETSDRITMQVGNKYYHANVNDTNRISATKNVYLSSGTTIKIKNASTYMFGVFSQSGEDVVTSNVDGTCLQAWTTNDYIISSDGWYGIAIKRSDNVDFNLGSTDSNYLDDYVTYVAASHSVDVSLQLGNKYDSNYSSASNRATVVKNVYLIAGTTISLKNSSIYNYGLCSQNGETISSNTSYLTGGWTANNYTITSNGYYGITFKRVDGADFDLGGNDSNLLTDYLNFN